MPQALLKSRLQTVHPALFSIVAGSAAFVTYFAMYAFRKPFTAGVYEGYMVGAFDYKILAISVQVIGYTISKFAGIKIVSEMSPGKRVLAVLALIGFAWLALVGFGAVPAPWNLVFLLLNGLPLGMIWGIVFSFLEGRRFTELLGATMAASFIVASGAVKAVGLALVQHAGISEFWMPFWTGLLFVPPLLIGAFFLSALPPPSEEDEAYRTKRVPMDSAARVRFFKTFATGIVLATTIYIALTIFRDVRDNFAVELWAELGFADQPAILALAEIPIAITVLILIGAMSIVKRNRPAFFMNYWIIGGAGALLIATTVIFQKGGMNPALWMIVNGFSMYLAYIAYHTFLFERWIAHFRISSNIGFLMYVVDAFGYLGSVGILFVKNFTSLDVSWLSFFTTLAYICGAIMIVLAAASIVYFLHLERRPAMAKALQSAPVPEI